MAIDFGKLVYLEVQKTGSSYICEFLNNTCTLERVRWDHHVPVADDYDPDTFYFNSIRHPLSTYFSLYRYGFNNRGALAQRLQKEGYGALYDRLDPEAFDKWLKFVLDDANAELVAIDFHKHAGRLDIGLQTYRYLRLSFAFPYRLFDQLDRNEDLYAAFSEKRIVDFTVRQECMNDDLIRLSMQMKPEFFEAERVRTFLNQESRVNKASEKHVQYTLSKEARRLLLQKEKFILSIFYPDSVAALAG